jgi:hypothetical protein
LPNACWLPARSDVSEVLTVHIREACPACCGVGRVQQPIARQAARICDSCGGSGKKRFTPMHRARAIGVSIVQYDALWHDRYESSLRMLRCLDEWAERQLTIQSGKKGLA